MRIQFVKWLPEEDATSTLFERELYPHESGLILNFKRLISLRYFVHAQQLFNLDFDAYEGIL